jgi:lysophospholipase L1-like esterase
LNRISYSALFLSILTLASCGGGGGDNAGNAAPNSPVPVSAAVPPAQTLASVAQVIEYYGDSTVWGWESGSGGTQVAKPAPAAFAEALPTSPRHQVRNEGVSGTTACELLNGQDGAHPAWDSQMASSSATVVIINHAINDFDPIKGENIPTYKLCLQRLAEIGKKSGKRVIFETPNPIGNMLGDPNGLEGYVAAMKEVASMENISVIDQYAKLKKSLDDGTRIEDMCPDGIHPSVAVYIEKGQYAASVFVMLPV